MTTAEILESQRTFFASGKTLDVKFRIEKLKVLKNAIELKESEILLALQQDLGKTASESYMCEVALVKAEINHALKNIKRWAKAKRVRAGFANFQSRCYTLPCPKGNVLIMSPWNYPFLLTMSPLVACISAGNTAIVKPSAYSPNTSKVIFDMLGENFAQNYIATLTGGRDVNKDLLTLKFDHIFFTGSKAVGHEVLKSAEKYMTPVTLELGGKSPCIIDETATLELAAKRIVFGKFLNVGQTCVAPDYVLVKNSIKDKFVATLIAEVKKQYSENALDDETYGKMVNEKQFLRAKSLLEKQNIIFGGKTSDEKQKIEPTIVLDPSLESDIMKEEIFAPILPVISFEKNEEALEIIKRNDTPLALYVFAENRQTQKFFTEKVKFGGGCINDTIMQIASTTLPFGGVGESGMGAYHGKRGFETFSHYKSIVNKSTKIDINLRYRPYTEAKDRWVRKLIK